jgi:hypothetical protein
MYLAVSRAGKRTILGGSGVAAVSTSGLYALYALHAFPPLAALLLIGGVAAGFGVMLWGGAVSPRLAERTLRRELKHPKLLSPALGREGTLSG